VGSVTEGEIGGCLIDFMANLGSVVGG
jgi:hypothetical protein